MEYMFFYLSAIVIVFIFVLCFIYKKFSLSNVQIGVASIGYSLIVDILFGDQLELFHYINPQTSTFYMVIAAILIYSPLNIIYTRFLPRKTKSIFIYTLCWITALVIFEIFSLITKTIVFTGWILFPWSIVLYIVSYLWIVLLYRFLKSTSHKFHN